MAESKTLRKGTRNAINGRKQRLPPNSRYKELLDIGRVIPSNCGLKGNCMSRRRTKKPPQIWDFGASSSMLRFARKVIDLIRGFIEAKLSEIGAAEAAMDRLTPKQKE